MSDGQTTSNDPLVASVLALGDETAQLGEEVHGITRQRKEILWLLRIVVVLFIINAVIVFAFFHQLNDTSHANRKTLQVVQSVTNPQAQAKQNQVTQSYLAFIIQCVETDVEHGTQVDPACPQASK